MLHRFLRVSTVTALAWLPAATFGQSTFEGVITVRLGSAQGADATYSVKGTQFRMDLAGPGGVTMYMLRDPAKNSTLMVLPAQQMYMEAGQMGGMGGRGGGRATETKVPDFKMTGKKETVAGHECEHMLITNDDGTQYDACVARGLGTFVAMNNPMARGAGGGGDTPAWQRLGGDFFPLKVQKIGGDVAFEVTKIERKPLDDGLFKLPDGYQKLDMGMRMGRPPR